MEIIFTGEIKLKEEQSLEEEVERLAKSFKDYFFGAKGIEEDEPNDWETHPTYTLIRKGPIYTINRLDNKGTEHFCKLELTYNKMSHSLGIIVAYYSNREEGFLWSEDFDYLIEILNYFVFIEICLNRLRLRQIKVSNTDKEILHLNEDEISLGCLFEIAIENKLLGLRRPHYIALKAFLSESNDEFFSKISSINQC